MFELARYHAPSTIFLDELDALASHRDASGEHEGSRRLKAELLIQLDGLAHTADRVFLLATSNLPWQVTASFSKICDCYF
jgi:katanin p60 ATPase-containing subunit A1